MWWGFSYSDALKYRGVVKLPGLNTGNMLNYQEICSEMNAYYQELRKIISALSETFMVHLIRPFHKNPRTEIRKTPRIYFLIMVSEITSQEISIPYRQDRIEVP